MHNKNAVLILEKEYNKNLINSIFKEKDPSGYYHVQNIFYKGKNKLWFELVSSYIFQKYTHGVFNRLLTYDKSFVSEVEKISKEYNRVYVFISSSFFQGPSWEKEELTRIKKKCPNLSVILYYIDIIQSKYSRWANLYRERFPKLFDLIYTSDEMDAKLYGFIYYPLPYAYIVDAAQIDN